MMLKFYVSSLNRVYIHANFVDDSFDKNMGKINENETFV